MRLGTYYRSLVCKAIDLPLSGGRVLDIGGYDGYQVSRIDANEKTVIDLDVLRLYEGIRYIERDFLRYDTGKERFDRVYAFDVLEHVPDDRAFIGKALESLADDGVAILSTPSAGIKIFPSFLQPWVDKKWQHHIRRGYSGDELASLTGDTGCRTKVDVIEWNCPVFRFLYLPLSLLWRVSPGMCRIALSLTVMADKNFKSGRCGFLFVIVRRI